jgi:hypothetical protein
VVQGVPEDFKRFWDIETQPSERRKLLTHSFQQIWAQADTIVTVKPHNAFSPHFKTAQQTPKQFVSEEPLKLFAADPSSSQDVAESPALDRLVAMDRHR